VPLLRRTLGEHIEIQTDLAPCPQSALTDRALLESALLNLAVNAGDAMPRGGALTRSPPVHGPPHRASSPYRSASPWCS
jgi:signal transduction histidine kinase